ncbi:hypothetical protein VDGL01_04935 [Verticillium dahliae]
MVAFGRLGVLEGEAQQQAKRGYLDICTSARNWLNSTDTAIRASPHSSQAARLAGDLQGPMKPGLLLWDGQQGSALAETCPEPNNIEIEYMTLYSTTATSSRSATPDLQVSTDSWRLGGFPEEAGDKQCPMSGDRVEEHILTLLFCLPVRATNCLFPSGLHASAETVTGGRTAPWPCGTGEFTAGRGFAAGSRMDLEAGNYCRRRHRDSSAPSGASPGATIPRRSAFADAYQA